MGLKQAILAKAFVELFKYGERNNLHEDIARIIEENFDKWIGEKRSERIQKRFEKFLTLFIRRMIKEFQKDRPKLK